MSNQLCATYVRLNCAIEIITDRSVFSMILLKKFQKDLRDLADARKATVLQSFFKTGIGEYGEGDKFLGVTVPQQRRLIKNYFALSLDDITYLLSSVWHEERLSALLLLVAKYQEKGDYTEKLEVYDFYLKHIAAVNNWDLVDLTASYIVGNFLFNFDADVYGGGYTQGKNILFTLVQDKNLWSRRIAIVATHYFIRHNLYQETLAITVQLLNDREDLIHKACGWMLREVGKRDTKILQDFLSSNYHKMPRTMLRYAIERFSEHERKIYLRK